MGKEKGKESLYNSLVSYCNEDYVPMHMPGAKRNEALCKMDNPYKLDITEIENFDNLHNAHGIIKKSFEKCAELFGADESLFLINGSSAGIMAAICGSTRKRDKIIMSRNSHKSVYNAVYLNELNPIYIYPKMLMDSKGDVLNIFSGVHLSDIKELIDNNSDASVVFITSPTYEGMTSQIQKIADYVHKAGMILIVDEAHGAHFNFHKAFPPSAITCGADIVIQSIHKTLPAFTQTALLHFAGGYANRDRVKLYWNMFQSTSPSYILMAGIDNCINILKEQGKQLFDNYLDRLTKLRKRLSALKNLQLINSDDISKIVILVSNGKKLYDILINRYKIQLEMASNNYVIAMTSIADTDEYYNRFAAALEEIDKNWIIDNRIKLNSYNEIPAVIIDNYYDTVNSNNKQYFSLVESIGKVCAVSICFYPPGVPIVNPGELITDTIIDKINEGLNADLEVIGIKKLGEELNILCLK